jgi:hypothetical protein
MRRTLLFALALGCQEFSVDDIVKDPPLGGLTDTASDSDTPIDTDEEEEPTDDRAPDIEVDPPELLFGGLPTVCDVWQELTITNVGDAPLTIDEITLMGPQANAFGLAGGGAGRIFAGQSITVDVNFAPISERVYGNASVRITSDDPDEGSVDVFLRGSGLGGNQVEDEWVQRVVYDVVDVLFVIDTSESMEDNLTALGNAMNSFIQQFVALGLDFHIGVTTTDMEATGAQGALIGPVITSFTLDPVSEFNALLDQGTAGSFDEVAFEASRTALTAPRINQTPNNTFLRTDAALAVVVLSDEDDQGANPANGAIGNPGVTDAYVAWLLSMKPDTDMVTFNGMVGPQSGGVLTACAGGIFAPQVTRAPQYNRAIRNTGGVWSNMCNLNVVPFLQHLGASVAGLDDTFALSQTPSSTDCADLVVAVNGVDIPCSEWTYDPASNSVTVSQAAVAGPGENTQIRYPVNDPCP